MSLCHFFYTTSTYLLCNKPEEVLFSCFVTMLNYTFERELALIDKGYESGSKTSNLPTPLRWTSRIHYISDDENISFDPSTPPQLPTSQITSLYNADYHSAVLMMKTFLQFIVHHQHLTTTEFHGFCKATIQVCLCHM